MMNPLSYSGFSSPCLTVLTAACSGFTEQGVSNLSVAGIPGIQSVCMSKIPPQSFTGWNKNQVAAFSSKFGYGCYGLLAKQLEILNATSYSGFTSNCVSVLSTSCAGFTKEGVSNLTLAAVTAISGVCMSQISNVSFSGFSVNQIQSFNTHLDGGCSGITPNQIEVASSTQIQAFPTFCISFWSYKIVNQIPAEQIHFLLGSQCAGFLSVQVDKFTNESLLKFYLSQLGNFSRSGISGFTTSQLFFLVKYYQRSFVTLYNQTQLDAIYKSTIYDFKTLFNSTLTPFLKKDDPLYSSLSFLQWMEIAFLVDEDYKSLITVTTFPTLSPQGVKGTRIRQVQLLDPTIFSALTPLQAPSLFPDTMSAMSGPQFAAIPPISFANITKEWISYISISAIPSLTVEQLKRLGCSKISYFTPQQRARMSQLQNQTLYEINCFPSPPSGGNGPAQYIIYIGIGGGVLLLIIIGVVVYFFVYRKRKHYASLN